jgi:hypothetical protein
VKFAVAPETSDVALHEIAPVPPEAGVVHDQPAGEASDTNVVFAGVVSLNVTVAASLGPAFVTAIA